jgi:hypothetical protein
MIAEALLAGADARTITPPLGASASPVFLAGFQGDRRATAIAHELYVRSLAISSDAGRPFALAVCDLIGLVRSDTLEIRESVADLGADVVVTSTHTHSGPDTIGLWGPDENTRGVNEVWLAGARATVADSIRAAVGSREPAAARVATTAVDDVIANLRAPDVVDAQVGALALDRASGGGAIATLANVGCHPEVLDGGSTVISSDMAGACVRAVEAVRGGVGFWVSGDLGGMQSPVDGPRTMAEADRKGAACAAAALAALAAAEPLSDATVRYRSSEVALPLWNPAFRAGLASGLLSGTIEADGTIVTEVGLMELGPSRWACWPGEVLPRLGLESKRRLGTPHPFIVGLANDELGYIVPDEDFVEPADWEDPGRQYEESMSVGPTTGSTLLAALDLLIERGSAGRGAPSTRAATP